MTTERTVTGTIELGVGGYRLQARVTVPADPVPLRVMLPVVQNLANALVDVGVQAEEEQGRTVSCQKGCGACCRQLVPISEVEAHRIAALVEELPEPRRSTVKERFANAARQLEESGLAAVLERRAGWEESEVSDIGLSYFQQGIPCPFLEEESCSIHPDRPVTCREYLVTSPAENCAQPTRDNIALVPLPTKLWTHLARFGPMAPDEKYVPWVPLVLAPAWAQGHAESTELRTGPQWVEALIQKLAALAPAAPASTAPEGTRHAGQHAE